MFNYTATLILLEHYSVANSSVVPVSNGNHEEFATARAYFSPKGCVKLVPAIREPTS